MRYFGILNRFNLILAVILSLCLAKEKIYAAKCPCDIYEAGATPCVAAHSTVRALYSNYNGPLYQVRRLSDNKTKDIGVISPGGLANTAPQDTFLGSSKGTISIIYDQSPNGNNLKSGYSGTWTPPDTEARVTDGKIKLNGYTVYGVYTSGGFTPNAGIGYRNNSTKGLATGTQAEGMYMVCDGKHYNQWCCFDYGNAETSGIDEGNATMECVYYGNTTQWSHCGGDGPWVEADMENGLCCGGSFQDKGNTPINANYITGIVKGKTENWYSIKAGDAQSGKLETKYAGTRPSGYYPMKLQGAIILGIGGDNSHAAVGTFFEGAITKGCPSDATDDSLQANIVAAGYGKTATLIRNDASEAATASLCKVNCNPSNGNAVISYTLQDARHVSMTIVDQQGRHIAAVVNGTMSAGRHEAVWDAKRVPAGVYVWRIEIDGRDYWAGRIVIGK